jgi:hypothetical protein
VLEIPNTPLLIGEFNCMPPPLGDTTLSFELMVALPSTPSAGKPRIEAHSSESPLVKRSALWLCLKATFPLIPPNPICMHKPQGTSFDEMMRSHLARKTLQEKTGR